MGSKGNQSTTSGTQTFRPNPYVAGAGQTAIQGAEYAAGQPFQMPVAPLAPFTPYQMMAQQGVAGAYGMAQPFFGAGAGYLQGSAAPVTGQDVAGYYNPMAANVMAGLKDVFGQQMGQATGQMTQAAGGVGADRIGVAQANLARQQDLAAGQTLAGLYYPALQAAEQQKQMMAGAGYGLAQMGPAAQAAQLQSAQALGGAGAQQQAMSQAYLNALYQNRLAQIGYPFQTPQYLAGITGGLAPAMGGTTTGTQTTTYPTPSPFQQALGVGVAGLGAYMGMPGLGMSGMKGMGGGSAYNPMIPGSLYKRGGAVPHMATGGTDKAIYNPQPIGQSAQIAPSGGLTTGQALSEADPFFGWYGGGSGGSALPDWATQQISQITLPTFSQPTSGMAGGSPGGKGSLWARLLRSGGSGLNPQEVSHDMLAGLGGLSGSQFANGGDVGSDSESEALPNPPMPSFSPGRGASPVPYLELRPGGGSSGMPGGQAIDLRPLQQPKDSSGKQRQPGGSLASDIGRLAGTALDTYQGASEPTVSEEPAVEEDDDFAQGGGVHLDDIGQSFQNGGPPAPSGLVPADDPDNPQPDFTVGDVVSRAKDFYRPAIEAITPPPLNPDSPLNIRRYLPKAAEATPAPAPTPAPGIPLPMPRPTAPPPRAMPSAPPPVDIRPPMAQVPPSPAVAPGVGPSAPSAPMPTAAQRYMMPREAMPYPTGGARGQWGQQVGGNPLAMALVRAGATIAATPGPIGSAIGRGIGAAASGMEADRRSLTTEESINQKAQALYAQAMTHLDRYNQMTPYERYKMGHGEQATNIATQKLGLAYEKMARDSFKDQYPMGDIPQDKLEAKIHELMARYGHPVSGETPATIQKSGSENEPIPYNKGIKRRQGLWYLTSTGKHQWTKADE